MANLKDLIVNGSARVLGTIYGTLEGTASKIFTPRATTDYNSLAEKNITKITEEQNGSVNAPESSSWYFAQTMQGGDTNYAGQMAMGMTTQNVYYRNKSGGTWSGWKRLVYSDGSITGSSGSCTGNSATATTATNANNLKVSEHSANNTTYYPIWANGEGGTGTNRQCYVTKDKLKFVPATGTLSATTFSGNLSGTANLAKACLPTETALSNGTIALTKEVTLYSRAVSAATTFAFSTTNLGLADNQVYTFELRLSMPTVYAITFPSTVSWLNGEAPDLSQTGNYLLAFRTYDKGSHWVGNLQGKW